MQSSPEREESERKFLSEMTTLARKYRLGITGEAFLFMMEWDDNEREYECDSEGKLSFR